MYFNTIEKKRDSMAEWNQFSPKVRQMEAVLKFDMFLYDNHAVMDHILIFRALYIFSTSIYSKKKKKIYIYIYIYIYTISREFKFSESYAILMLHNFCNICLSIKYVPKLT